LKEWRNLLMSTLHEKILNSKWYFQSQQKTLWAFMAPEDWFYETCRAKCCVEARSVRRVAQRHHSQHSRICAETAYRFSDNFVFQFRRMKHYCLVMRNLKKKSCPQSCYSLSANTWKWQSSDFAWKMEL
jgi:hypothetical protein